MWPSLRCVAVALASLLYAVLGVDGDAVPDRNINELWHPPMTPGLLTGPMELSPEGWRPRRRLPAVTGGLESHSEKPTWWTMPGEQFTKTKQELGPGGGQQIWNKPWFGVNREPDDLEYSGGFERSSKSQHNPTDDNLISFKPQMPEWIQKPTISPRYAVWIC